MELLQVDNAQSKQGGAKNIRCIFCNTFLTGRRAVLVQKKAHVGSCIPISELLLVCLKANKSVLDSMIYSGKRIVTGYGPVGRNVCTVRKYVCAE